MASSIRTLRAAGLSDAQIIRVIEEEQAERREKDRIRQRNHRSRHADMRDIRDKRDTLSPSHTLPLSYEQKPKKVSVRSARTKLPENFHPELVGEREFDKFCDHARANARLCADWEAALRNWRRNAPRFAGNGNGHHQGSETWKDQKARETYEAVQQLKSYRVRNDDTGASHSASISASGVVSQFKFT